MRLFIFQINKLIILETVFQMAERRQNLSQNLLIVILEFRIGCRDQCTAICMRNLFQFNFREQQKKNNRIYIRKTEFFIILF